MNGQVKLRVVPCSVEKAREYVERVHRHHTASTGARYCVAVVDETGLVRGVAMVGRPVARILDDGWTLEVNRVATDGCENACSALYGAARRIANALGYSRLITYIREDEPGTSLRAVGWTNEGPIRARSWNMPGRPRVDKTEIVRRERWTCRVVGANPIDLIWPEVEDNQLAMEVPVYVQAGAEAPATHMEGADQSASPQPSSQHSRSPQQLAQPPQTRQTA